MPWAKERMPELFEGAKIIENGEDLIKITKVDTMNGECHINTRKGKIFHFFEFEIKLKWSGKHTHTRATLIFHYYQNLPFICSTLMVGFHQTRYRQGRQGGGQL